MEYFFQTERLCVGYNGKSVIENIEITLKKGQILTVIGPNGSGKSTILKSVAKQLKTIGGVIRIGGNSASDIKARELSRLMALVLTERPKPERMTCGDVVAVGRYPYTGILGALSAADKAKIDGALKAAGAFDIKDCNFMEVSDGQLQRIMLARAICQEPEIIVLDEPTSFLDIRSAVEILDILRQMASEQSVTVIMSLHELIYAKRVSDLAMCVKDGLVLHFDIPEVIFTKEIISRLYDLPDNTYEQLFGGF